MATVDHRKQFLLEYYKSCWENVSRSEDAAWKMFAAYTAVLAGLSFVFEQIGTAGFLMILTAFSFLAIGLSMNANLWFVRNIGIISNLEKEFLSADDYNVLIPEQYKGKIPFVSFVQFEAWWVLVVGYFFICLIFQIVLFGSIPTLKEKTLVAGVYLISMLLTSAYGVSLSKRHNDFVKNAPGKKIIAPLKK